MKTPSKSTRPNAQLANSEKYHHKCVCDICTCGKHTCPEKSLKFEGETTNNHYYKPYSIVPDNVARMAYNPEQKHYDPNLIQSTYHSAYTSHPLEKQQLQTQPYGYQPSRGRFEDETEYKKNYIPSQLMVERPLEPMKYTPNNAKFEGSTTYNREYSPKHAPHQTSAKHYEYKPNNAPFVGQTTYESEYKPHRIESYRPDASNRYQSKNAPFVGESRYKQEYVAYKVQTPEVCATEQLPSRPQRCSPGKDHLHYTASRNQWE